MRAQALKLSSSACPDVRLAYSSCTLSQPPSVWISQRASCARGSCLWLHECEEPWMQRARMEAVWLLGKVHGRHAPLFFAHGQMYPRSGIIPHSRLLFHEGVDRGQVDNIAIYCTLTSQIIQV